MLTYCLFCQRLLLLLLIERETIIRSLQEPRDDVKLEDSLMISCWKGSWVQDWFLSDFWLILTAERKQNVFWIVHIGILSVYTHVSWCLLQSLCVCMSVRLMVCASDQRAWRGSVITALFKCHVLHRRWNRILVQRKLHRPISDEKEEATKSDNMALNSVHHLFEYMSLTITAGLLLHISAIVTTDKLSYY